MELTGIFNNEIFEENSVNEEYTEYEKSIITQYTKRINSNECQNAIIAYNYLYGNPVVFGDSVTKRMTVYTDLLGRIDLNLRFDRFMTKNDVLYNFKQATEIEAVLTKLSLEDFVNLCGFKDIDNIEAWQTNQKLPITKSIGEKLWDGLTDIFIDTYAPEKTKAEREELSLLTLTNIGCQYCVTDICFAFVAKYGIGAKFVDD